MKRENTLVYQPGTETIRQMPGNYLIAHKGGYNSWACQPDLACDEELAVRVFRACLKHENKYGSGENLLKACGFGEA